MMLLQDVARTSREQALILWFEEVDSKDVGLVGGKNSSLGEMIQQLTPKGINVPTGFATTAYAYRHFVEKAGLDAQRLTRSEFCWTTGNLPQRARGEGSFRSLP